jgi:hypothetical protein
VCCGVVGESHCALLEQVLRIGGAAGEWEGALALFEAAARGASKGGGGGGGDSLRITPGTETANTMLAVLAEAGQAAQAARLFAALPKLQVPKG